MTDIREMALSNEIFRVRVGSHLYGTNCDTSDEDFKGCFVAPIRYQLGFNSVEQVDFSKVSKDESGKNTSEAVDCELYEVKKLFKLVHDCNPNALEIAFVPPEHRIKTTVIGELFFRMAKSFVVADSVQTKFLGYSRSQKHKMRCKPENLESLEKFVVVAEEIIRNNPESCKYLVSEFREVPEVNSIVKFHLHHCEIGDLSFSNGRQLGKVLESVTTRIEKTSHRREIWEKYGYDTKFGLHLLRLLYEAEELLTFGSLEFPLKSARFLREVRGGSLKLEELLSLADHLEDRVKYAHTVSRVRNEPMTEYVEDQLIWIIKEHSGLNPAKG